MTPFRRDDAGPPRERTAEERERDRREREARRAGRAAGAPPPDVPPPAVPPRPPRAPARSTPPSSAPEEQTPVEEQAPVEHEAPPVERPAPPPVERPAPPPVEREAPPVEQTPPERRAPAVPPPEALAPPPPTRSEEPAEGVRRIQPEPPAPPAAPAGALSDEHESPLGVRWARRLAPRRPVVTPPADVPRGPARARRSVGIRIFAIIALLILAALALGIVKVFEPFAGDPGLPIRVEIPSGSSVGQIGDRLAAANVVDSSMIFNLRATLAGKRGDLQSGSYQLRRNMTYGTAIETLSSPPSQGATIDVTIPEGRSRREIVPIVRDAKLKGDYLSASRRFSGALDPYRHDAPRGTRSLEGFLFPATYELRLGADARDLVERQLAAFERNFKRVDLRRAHRRKLSAYEVLIIASMVEREAQLAREQPIIAAVIYNRLEDGMPLGIDATTRYALRKWSGALTDSELKTDSPFNTRKRAGLPPTPIGNPGLSSIRAAAAPARVDFRYFVVKPGTCGEHAFSVTYRRFVADSRRYHVERQRRRRSPVDC